MRCAVCSRKSTNPLDPYGEDDETTVDCEECFLQMAQAMYAQGNAHQIHPRLRKRLEREAREAQQEAEGD